MRGANPKTPEVLALWQRGDLTTKQVADRAGVSYSVAYAIITRGIRTGRCRPRRDRGEKMQLQTLCRRHAMGVGYFGRYLDDVPTQTLEAVFTSAIAGKYGSIAEYAVDMMLEDVLGREAQ